MRRARALLLVPLAAALAGCGGAAAVRVTGATPLERRAVETVLAEMRPSTIRTVGLSPFPGGLVEIHVGAGSSLRGAWESALLDDVYAAAASRLRLRPVARAASGGATEGAAFTPITPARLAAARAAVARLHVEVAELRDEAGAVAITLRPPVVAEFLRHRAPQFVRDLVRAGLTRAIYVGIEDPSGAVVYAWGWLPTEGMFYARPDLYSCGPFSHYGTYGENPPPCPLWRPPSFGLW